MTNYVKCPRCLGSRYVNAIAKAGDGFTPTRTEEFKCPLCDGASDVDETKADEYAAEQKEQAE